MDNQRLERVLALIDAANALDPNKIATPKGEQGEELVYGRRMSAALAQLQPAASEALQIAVRGQHIERWTLPRSDYPDGKTGYFNWRREQARRHAARVAELMAEAGYDAVAQERVASLLQKKSLKRDDEAQALEDVACLVFLQHYAPAFIAKHDDDKVVDILVKTARKMSPDGLAAAAKCSLDDRLGRLLTAALSG